MSALPLKKTSPDRAALADNATLRRGYGSDHGSAAAWRFAAYFGWLLIVVGATDVLLAWYPAAFGDPTWEFGTITTSYVSLPLLTMGLAGVLAATVALDYRRSGWAMAIAMVLLGLALLSAYILFYLLNVPVALELSPPEISVGLKKSIVKTSVLAIAFSLAYVLAGVLTMRHFNSVSRRG